MESLYIHHGYQAFGVIAIGSTRSLTQGKPFLNATNIIRVKERILIKYSTNERL